MLSDRIKWPEGKVCAAMITVNLEAQYFAKMYYPDEDINMKDGEIAIGGKEGMIYGLPKLLDVFDKYDIRATFFILAATAEDYPEVVKNIASRGHEIGCHGYYHENLARLTSAEQRKILQDAKDKLEEISGKKIKAFRMPEGEMTEETLMIVKELGFEYSSSLSDNDIPYIRKSCGLTELPIHWELYDLPYYAYTFEPMIPCGQDRCSAADDVLQNWKIELEAAKRFGTLYNLQLDPQATGEQGRLFTLQEIIKDIRKDETIWLAAGEDIASFCSRLTTKP